MDILLEHCSNENRPGYNYFQSFYLLLADHFQIIFPPFFVKVSCLKNMSSRFGYRKPFSKNRKSLPDWSLKHILSTNRHWNSKEIFCSATNNSVSVVAKKRSSKHHRSNRPDEQIIDQKLHIKESFLSQIKMSTKWVEWKNHFAKLFLSIMSAGFHWFSHQVEEPVFGAARCQSRNKLEKRITTDWKKCNFSCEWRHPQCQIS